MREEKKGRRGEEEEKGERSTDAEQPPLTAANTFPSSQPLHCGQHHAARRHKQAPPPCVNEIQQVLHSDGIKRIYAAWSAHQTQRTQRAQLSSTTTGLPERRRNTRSCEDGGRNIEAFVSTRHPFQISAEMCWDAAFPNVEVLTEVREVESPVTTDRWGQNERNSTINCLTHYTFKVANYVSAKWASRPASCGSPVKIEMLRVKRTFQTWPQHPVTDGGQFDQYRAAFLTGLARGHLFVVS